MGPLLPSSSRVTLPAGRSREPHRAYALSVAAPSPEAPARRVVSQDRLQALPHVTYSTRKRDVDAVELGLLLSAAYTSTAPEAALWPHLQHWQAAPGCQRTQRLQLALQGSAHVVAAYAHIDELAAGNESSRGVQRQQQQQQPPPLSIVAGGTDWSLQLGQPARPKSLVGFARAAGDGCLVATVYDLAVHPRLQGLGLGRRMLKMLVQQISSSTFCDIGSLVPLSLSSFFHTCDFELDPSAAIMFYRPDSAAAAAAAAAAAGAASPAGGPPQASSAAAAVAAALAAAAAAAAAAAPPRYGSSAVWQARGGIGGSLHLLLCSTDNAGGFSSFDSLEGCSTSIFGVGTDPRCGAALHNCGASSFDSMEGCSIVYDSGTGCTISGGFELRDGRIATLFSDGGGRGGRSFDSMEGCSSSAAEIARGWSALARESSTVGPSMECGTTAAAAGARAGGSEGCNSSPSTSFDSMEGCSSMTFGHDIMTQDLTASSAVLASLPSANPVEGSVRSSLHDASVRSVLDSPWLGGASQAGTNSLEAVNAALECGTAAAAAAPPPQARTAPPPAVHQGAFNTPRLQQLLLHKLEQATQAAAHGQRPPAEA